MQYEQKDVNGGTDQDLVQVEHETRRRLRVHWRTNERPIQPRPLNVSPKTDILSLRKTSAATRDNRTEKRDVPGIYTCMELVAILICTVGHN